MFDELDIPTLYADTMQINVRSQHVLEKQVLLLSVKTIILNTIESIEGEIPAFRDMINFKFVYLFK